MLQRWKERASESACVHLSLCARVAVLCASCQSLGCGEFSVVFLGRRLSDGSAVAVKAEDFQRSQTFSSKEYWLLRNLNEGRKKARPYVRTCHKRTQHARRTRKRQRGRTKEREANRFLAF